VVEFSSIKSVLRTDPKAKPSWFNQEPLISALPLTRKLSAVDHERSELVILQFCAVQRRRKGVPIYGLREIIDKIVVYHGQYLGSLLLKLSCYVVIS
jgi:hypothetical protein